MRTMTQQNDPHNETPAATGNPAGTPRWVKVSGVIALVIVVLVVVLLLSGHGPAQHLPA